MSTEAKKKAVVLQPVEREVTPLPECLRKFVLLICNGEDNGAVTTLKGSVIPHIKRFVETWAVVYFVGDSKHALKMLELAHQGWKAQEIKR